MQFLPVSATETVIREISYALPDDRREMKAARYLNWRINRRVNAEDTELIARVQRGCNRRPTCGAAGDERSVPAQLRAEIPAADSGGAAGSAAAAGLEPTRDISGADRADRKADRSSTRPHRRGLHPGAVERESEEQPMRDRR